MEQVAKTSNPSCGVGPWYGVRVVEPASMMKRTKAARSKPMVGLIAKALMLVAVVPAQAQVNGLPKTWTVQNFDGSTSVCRRSRSDPGGSTCKVQPGTAPVRVTERVPQSSPNQPVPVQESRPRINWGNVLVGALVLGAVAYAASNGTSGGGGYSATQSDYKWSWDQFGDGNGVLIWRCRGEQTGQFADDWRCAGLYRADSKWPGPQLY